MNNNELMNTLIGALSGSDSKDKLSEVLNMFSQKEKEEAKPQQPVITSSDSSSSDFLNPEMIVKIKGMLDNFNRTDDTRIGLLNSIKPYMKSTRVKNIDMAIKFIQFINFASGFKNREN